MSRVAPTIILAPEEREALNKIVRTHRSEQRMAQRARIILMASEGLQNQRIAEQLSVSFGVVSKWRSRFAESRLDGLADHERPGTPRRYGHDERLAVIRASCRRPAVESHWSIRDVTRTLSNEYGLKMSHMTVHRILSQIDLKPHQCQSWLESQDPEFEAKQAQIVGLYLNPPDNALVICVDEKTGIQALGRPMPAKPMAPGKPERQDAHYVRHGTQSLIAALLAHEGKVYGACADRHRSLEFVSFVNSLVDAFPDKDLYFILDNLSSHKSKVVREWAETKGGRVHFAYTPTRASWLNQIELWFSILTRKVLKRGVFDSKEDLVKTIMAFIERHNETAKPFAWTYKGDPLKVE